MPTTRNGQPDIPRRSVLTGEPLPPDRVIERARRRNAERARLERRRILADALTATDVAALTGVTIDEVERLARDRRLLAVEHEGAPRFPAWQFVEVEGAVRVVAGLELVVAALPSQRTGVELARWFETAKDHLDGDTPAAWLRRRNALQPVIEAAHARGAS